MSIVDEARAYLGVPYVWGGTTPAGFDCSGFTQYVYRKFGIALPRTAQQQYDATDRVARGDLVPGDLVFFERTYDAGPNEPITHNGIYLGDNQMIDAAGSAVRYDDLTSTYWSAHYAGGGRPRGFHPAGAGSQAEPATTSDQPAPIGPVAAAGIGLGALIFGAIVVWSVADEF